MPECYIKLGMFMNIKCVKMNKKYIRKIEGMSKGLLLFKVGAEIKQSGQNFHLLYEDKRKPPLDIAINPNNGTIEYITYFIQDEKILSEKLYNEIDYQEGTIIVEDEQFNIENKFYLIVERKFDAIRDNNDILILSNSIHKEKLQAYKIDNMNYLLFSQSQFCGIVFKNILSEEWDEIINSQCV